MGRGVPGKGGQIGHGLCLGLAVGGEGGLHFGAGLGDDLRFGPVGEAAFDTGIDDVLISGKADRGTFGDGGLRAGLFGGQVMRQAIKDAVVLTAGKGDGGKIHLGCGAGAFGLAPPMIQQRLVDNKLRGQPGQAVKRENRGDAGPAIARGRLGPQAGKTEFGSLDPGRGRDDGIGDAGIGAAGGQHRGPGGEAGDQIRGGAACWREPLAHCWIGRGLTPADAEHGGRLQPAHATCKQHRNGQKRGEGRRSAGSRGADIGAHARAALRPPSVTHHPRGSRSRRYCPRCRYRSDPRADRRFHAHW